MAHPRRNIREKVVTLLVAAGDNGGWGSRVYDSQVRPIVAEDGTALRVYTLDDSFVEWAELEDRAFVRACVVTVEVHVATTTNLARTLDDSAHIAEAVFEDNPTLDDLALHRVQYQSSAQEFSADVDPPAGRATITYEVQYLDNAD